MFTEKITILKTRHFQEIIIVNPGVAQPVARWFWEPEVAGSEPATRTIKNKGASYATSTNS